MVTAAGSGGDSPPVSSAPSGWVRNECPECARLKVEFGRALGAGDRGEGERVMAVRGLHLYATHWGPSTPWGA